MVANRQSIAKVGKTLAELVIEGGGDTPTAKRLAEQLAELCDSVGVYRKRYETHEERVMHRHLNLYRNKLRKAKTDAERDRWQRKVTEQEARIAAFSQPLDLDGL